MVAKAENSVYLKWVPVIADRNKTNCFQVFHAMTMISDEMYAFELIFAIKWVT